MTYDLLIQNSRVADGTGQPAYQADVAVLDGKIAQIAPSIPVSYTHLTLPTTPYV